jgi:hypothetical protein
MKTFDLYKTEKAEFPTVTGNALSSRWRDLWTITLLGKKNPRQKLDKVRFFIGGLNINGYISRQRFPSMPVSMIGQISSAAIAQRQPGYFRQDLHTTDHSWWPRPRRCNPKKKCCGTLILRGSRSLHNFKKILKIKFRLFRFFSMESVWKQADFNLNCLFCSPSLIPFKTNLSNPYLKPFLYTELEPEPMARSRFRFWLWKSDPVPAVPIPQHCQKPPGPHYCNEL